MRAMVLWTINDFPARSSLSGWSRQGYKACLTCNEDIPSMRALSKTTYVGHKRFLKKPHKYRRSLEFNGEIEDGDPPRNIDRDQIQTQLTRLPIRVKGKHPSYRDVIIKRNILITTTFVKSSHTAKEMTWQATRKCTKPGVQHVAGDIKNIQSTSMVMYEREFFYVEALKCVVTIDVAMGQKFNMRAMVLWTINDFPARSSLSNVHSVRNIGTDEMGLFDEARPFSNYQ
nr:hypothetical protein [Tanacetum cinerariifolium]